MFWSKKKETYKYSTDRHYNAQGIAIWNIAGARHVWYFTNPIAITSVQTDTNTLGIRFPDAYGSVLNSFAIEYPLESVEILSPGFTALRASDPSQFAPSRPQFFQNKSAINPPIITRSIEFLSFGASGSVNWSISYFLCYTD